MAIFKLPSRRPQHGSNATKSSWDHALNNADVLLSIISFVDVPTLLNLRLVSRSTNAVIQDYKSWVCNAVAKNHYHWIFQFNDKAFRDHTSVPLHLTRFSTFRSIIRLHAAIILPLLLLWNQLKDPESQEVTLVLPGRRETASCARGFLILWALADIEHDVMGVVLRPRLSYSEYLSSSLNSSLSSRSVPLQLHNDRRNLSRLRPSMYSVRNFIKSPKHALTTPQRSKQSGLPRHGPRQPITFTSSFVARWVRLSRERAAYVSQLDQGSWMDLHVVTTAVLAFSLAYMTHHMEKANPKLRDLPNDHVWRSAEWAIRQGPDLLLCILSRHPTHRAWANTWVDRHWEMRASSIKMFEMGYSSGGPLGISTDAAGRYPHPKAQVWESQGWPGLLECTKDMLFKEWNTFRLAEDREAAELAGALRDRTGGIDFHTRV